ncbi:unnamed protein product [Adineta steineri]|uniref:F-box domain-containing protein n=1 Tax=Adineta steineri TaxID=433720 RepID=A0A814E6N6_9BILA|nr:unnamed protein product [Adineta steineri]CAF1055306.1 unnamed protein product [Adineta steineri]CAF3655736.1 unnamed protein product [Adineta steineri]CAF4093711.1 unnamed protein product [Adineta steineri]
MDKIFPDEIFLQIFQYVPRLDLFRSFYNLNSRLNRIISESNVYLGSVSLNKEEQQYILPYVQPKQIYSFPVFEEEYEYSKLSQCINIRELTFLSGSKEYNVYRYEHPQLIHVVPSIFPYLKSLTIYVQSCSGVYGDLCRMIFGNQFSVLESVYLPYGNNQCVSGIKTWSTNLKDVTIKCCNKSLYYPLLNNLPNILSFHCVFGVDSHGSLKKEYLPLTHIYLGTNDKLPTLFDYGTMAKLGVTIDLLERSPNLERTILFICDYHELGYIIDQLNRVLSNCPKLISFDCHIQHFRENSESINEIKNRYPLFQNCSAHTWTISGGYGACRIQK